MSHSNREFELKLTLDEAQMRRMRSKSVIRSLSNGRAVTRTLLSIYYDTPDIALRRAGLALRTRRTGRRWVQTVKAKGQVLTGVSDRVEVETPIRGASPSIDAIPDRSLREAIRATIGDQTLSPVIETHIRRTSRHLTPPTGGLVELCLDEGEIRAGGRTAPIHEAEIELANGDPAEVFTVAEYIFAGEVLQYSSASKSARGYRLLAGEDATLSLEPARAKSTALDASMTSEEAMREVLRRCFAQIAGNLPVAIKSETPAGPHQLRVGLRRLRSAFSVFRPLMGEDAVAPIAAEAKQLARIAGELRDMDVLIHDVVGPAAKAVDAAEDRGFRELLEALEDRRGEVKLDVARRLSTEGAQRLPLALGGFAEARGWLDPGDIRQSARLATPVRDFAAKQLNKRWSKAAKWGRRIEELPIPERHEMRKELKKFRYAVDFFYSLYPEERAKPFRKQLKRLQNVFGYLNDSAMAEATLPGIAGANPAASLAAGRVIGWCDANAEIAWRDAREKWSALKHIPAFWR